MRETRPTRRGAVLSATQRRPGDAASRVRGTGLSKSFGATRALVSADLDVRPGEVHTVMGENGSGKSTLVKLLSGVQRPDRGSLLVGEQDATRWRSPADARAAGTATVFQEVLTVPGSTIEANIWLGVRRGPGVPDGVARRRQAAEVMERLLGAPVDVRAPAESLSLSGRQACCIARALVRRPDVLVLDESTSALDIATRDRLFGVIRELTTVRGSSVVFISHRMDEVFDITDVVTVLRSGSTVVERLPIASTSVAALVELMSGAGSHSTPVADRPPGAVLLRADRVVLRPEAVPVGLELRAGELVGLAGLEGQGQERFLLALRGVEAFAGTVARVDGASSVPITSPAGARAAGIAYVPRERRHEALFQQLSIRENFGLATMREDTVGALLRPARTVARLRGHAERLNLRMSSPEHPVATLSGGNQQKVVLARALADHPAVLLLNDPTRGIDASAKQDVYRLLGELCAAGTAVVVLSTEVDELVELTDRVLVFRGHQLSAELSGAGLTRSAVVSAYFGPPAAQATGDHRQEATVDV